MKEKYFGVMLDCSRNAVMKPQEVVNFAKILKSFGYNMIQLYTEETYEVENEPFFGYMRGRYTQKELSYIVDECEKIGVEAIPCVQTLAHLNQALRWHPYVPIRDTGDIMLAGEERTYELIENMFKTLRKCFKTEYIHIGMDEAEMIGRGAYFNKHGVRDHLDILKEHLAKVCELAKKYNFKPIMWSDMFFKLATDGKSYYHENPNVTEEVKNAVPKEVGLVYWDYYHTDKAMYDGMFRAHKQFNNDVWFAGGAWTWTGFASGNDWTMQTMLPAMVSAKEHGVENIFFTLWGDNGKECSYYTVLPSLFALKKIYDGETDMQKIKAEFETLTGENYDALCACDLPNYVGGSHTVQRNVHKPALYSDPFNAWAECKVKDGVCEEYAQHAKTLADYASKSKNYAYILQTLSSLCDVLSIKYGLGLRTREVYAKKDKQALQALIQDYALIESKLEVFYKQFRELWYKENNPSGFDVQDIRIGGLKQRLISCRERLQDYADGKIDNIPELEEELLDCHPGADVIGCNTWAYIATGNVL